MKKPKNRKPIDFTYLRASLQGMADGIIVVVLITLMIIIFSK